MYINCAIRVDWPANNRNPNTTQHHAVCCEIKPPALRGKKKDEK
jgi:hypothetical protein